MKRLSAASIPFLFTTAALLAQTDSPAADATATAAASGSPELSGAAAAGIFGTFCLIWLIPIVLWLWAAIFVTKDAKRRNSPNATLVTVLTWIPFTWFIGWIIHLATRPKTTAA